MKKILIALMAVMITVGLVGIGTYAYFSDTETSLGNTFTAGTLDLKVDDKDDLDVVSIQLGDLKPGWSETYIWTLKNVGSIAGKVSFKFSPIINDDNFCNEPELVAGDITPGDAGGKGGGELGEYLKVWIKIGSYSQTGPFTLNSRGGMEYLTVVILGQDETVDISLTLSLPKEVENIVQSDSVKFDIIFHLDQS